MAQAQGLLGYEMRGEISNPRGQVEGNKRRRRSEKGIGRCEGQSLDPQARVFQVLVHIYAS